MDRVWITIGFKPYFYWSDLLVVFLLGGGGAWLLLALRREYWRSSLRQILKNRMAMVCLGVLCVYAGIGLADTIHYREVTEKNPSGSQIASVLDRLCKNLTDRRETTYSAPFASRAYSKENGITPEGKQLRDYPLLRHAGVNLANRDEPGGDILSRAAKGLGIGIAIGIALIVAARLLAGSKVDADSERHARRIANSYWIGCFLTIVVVLIAEAVALNANEGYHIFGTDKAGIDVLYSSLKSVRTGLIIGTLTTLIVTPFAVIFGAVAGYFGGFVDDVVQYVYTTMSSIPDILLIAAAMLILQVGLSNEESSVSADKRLIYLCVIMGITSWTELCRLIRAEVLKLREAEYVQAANAFGVGRLTIIVRHLVPNVMHIVLISIVLRFSGLVLAEAVLAYAGVGVDISTNSWGNMINQARPELAHDPVVWWNLAATFVFMIGLVLPANLFGDALRDALDPRLRTRA